LVLFIPLIAFKLILISGNKNGKAGSKAGEMKAPPTLSKDEMKTLRDKA
jgi:hypothetical protein